MDELLDTMAAALMDAEEFFTARDEMNAKVHLAEARWSPITLQTRAAVRAWQKHRYPDHSNDDVPWKKVAENLSKELTMERNWRMRLQEEVWALDPSKDPRRDGHGPEDYPHEHVYRCQDCGEIDGSGVTGGGSEKAPPPGQGALQPPAHIDGEA